MLARTLTGLIRFYQQWVSVAMPAACRFQPTCSEYALRAIRRHGPGRGGWLSVKRLARCHPWGGAGFDPVPKGPANNGEERRRGGG